MKASEISRSFAENGCINGDGHSFPKTNESSDVWSEVEGGGGA